MRATLAENEVHTTTTTSSSCVLAKGLEVEVGVQKEVSKALKELEIVGARHATATRRLWRKFQTAAPPFLLSFASRRQPQRLSFWIILFIYLFSFVLYVCIVRTYMGNVEQGGCPTHIARCDNVQTLTSG